MINIRHQIFRHRSVFSKKTKEHKSDRLFDVVHVTVHRDKFL